MINQLAELGCARKYLLLGPWLGIEAGFHRHTLALLAGSSQVLPRLERHLPPIKAEFLGEGRGRLNHLGEFIFGDL